MGRGVVEASEHGSVAAPSVSSFELLRWKSCSKRARATMSPINCCAQPEIVPLRRGAHAPLARSDRRPRRPRSSVRNSHGWMRPFQRRSDRRGAGRDTRGRVCSPFLLHGSGSRRRRAHSDLRREYSHGGEPEAKGNLKLGTWNCGSGFVGLRGYNQPSITHYHSPDRAISSLKLLSRWRMGDGAISSSAIGSAFACEGGHG